MPISTSGYDPNLRMALGRIWEKAVNGRTTAGLPLPVALNNEYVTALNAAGTGVVNILKVDTSDQVRIGSGTAPVKIFNRPTTDAFALQVKSEFTDTDAGHNCLEVTADWHPSATATAGGNTAVQGVSRLAASHTATGGTLIGTYGQVCNLGTLNGAGIMAAGMYGLIEDGGTYTAVSHVAAGWLDSHLSQTVTAGHSELLYMTNNGSTTLESAFYLRPGDKITNLFTIDTATGMVGDEASGDYTFTATRKIKVNIGGVNGVGGVTAYLIADIPS